MACYVYGKRIADAHLWDRRVKTTTLRKHGEGPLCIRCGLPLGTWQFEAAYDAHMERAGHFLGTGACEEVCGEDFDWAPDLRAALPDDREDGA